jgi:CBS domain-containing protein
MLIREILRVKGHTLFTTKPDGRIRDAVDVLVRHDVGSLVVMDAGRVVGMLTFREVLRALSERGDAFDELRVREVMVREPHAVTPHDTVDVAQQMMFEDKVRYLPVIEGSTLHGVISFRDIQKAMLDDLELENRTLKGYIAT